MALPDWDEPATKEMPERSGSWAFQMALCLLGPLFFLSYLFSILAPLPTLYLQLGTPNASRGRAWALAAMAVGVFLCFAVKGWFWGSLLYLLFAALPALLIGELLLRRLSPEKAITGAMLAVALATTFSAWGIARSRGLELVPAVKQGAEGFLKEKAEYLLSQKKEELPEDTRKALEQLRDSPGQELITLPGMGLFFLLLLCTLPVVALIRWNPKGFLRRTGIPRDFLRKWRSPEWLVWPALFCGAFHVFEVEILSDLARNALIPILLIYFFHGMSILAFFLDSLRLRGPFRVAFYGAAIVFLTPMVVSFGFFDLWFNFRRRNRPGADTDREVNSDNEEKEL
jgi:uncharacterized protein YybS (DUF2232 family)